MIEVRDLVKHLGDTLALDHLSFTAPTGEVTGLLGPNGAGKSTTMRVLATLLRPDQGQVVVSGHDVGREPDEVRRVIGLVTEEPGLYDRLTVREQLTFTGRAYGLTRERAAQRIDDIAEVLLFGDQLDRRAGTLSKGNRQKAALARALVHDPPVLLLDEPTAGLDVLATAGFADLLRRPEVVAGKTVLLSTHRLEEADQLAHHVVGIVEGRLAAEGTPTELARQAGTDTFAEAFITLIGRAVPGVQPTGATSRGPKPPSTGSARAGSPGAGDAGRPA